VSLGVISPRLRLNEWAVTNALIQTGVLTEAEALDPSRVAIALSEHINQWADCYR
jgi:hypothetical protein